MNLDNLVVDLHNVNITQNETCMICREELNEAQTYKLPECGHEYHTHCLISWFRNGDSRCPYCGNKGINYDSNQSKILSYRRRRRYRQDRIDFKLSEIKKFCKEPNAPIRLINLIKKLDDSKKNIAKFQESCKNYEKLINNEPVLYKTVSTERRRLRNKKYTAEDKYFKIRENIDELNIVPLIIPRPIDIN